MLEFNPNNTQNVYQCDRFGRICFPKKLLDKYKLINYVNGEKLVYFTNENGGRKLSPIKIKEENFMSLHSTNMLCVGGKPYETYINIVESDNGEVYLFEYSDRCCFCEKEITISPIFYFNQILCDDCYHELKDEIVNDKAEKSNEGICMFRGTDLSTDPGIIHKGHPICGWCSKEMIEEIE